ncbi:LacI family DNA-binding transcriptional regulator [Rathayibacter sp. CAU 1779]
MTVLNPRPRPTQADVARLADVSPSTVSYLLSGNETRKKTFPEATRLRVEQAAAELGYVINHRARALRRQRSEIVGVAYVPPVTPWFDAFSANAMRHFAEQDYSLVQIPFAPGATESVQRALTRGYLDAVIANCDDAENEKLIDLAADSGVPLTIFSDSLTTDRADVVREFQREALVDAVHYLADTGRTRITFLDYEASPGSSPDGNLRKRGYLDGMDEVGLAPRVVTCPDNRQATYDEVVAMLSADDVPDALISFSDRGAVSAIWAAQHVGVRVPDDLAVIGCGNTAEGRSTVPELTSLGIPEGDFAAIFTHVLDRIDDPSTPCTTLSLPWTRFIRASA